MTALYWSPPHLSTFITRQRSVVSVSGHSYGRPASCREARTVVVSLGTDRYMSTAYWAHINSSECPCPVSLVANHSLTTRVHASTPLTPIFFDRTYDFSDLRPPMWSSAAMSDTRPVQAMRLLNCRATTRSARMYHDGATCNLRCGLPIAHPSEHPAYTTQERRRCKSGK